MACWQPLCVAQGLCGCCPGPWSLTAHTCPQSQLASRKQALEALELASSSEIQHLTSKLERANDAICANELEVERLNMRVDDLTEDNQSIREDQQRAQEELRQSKKMLEVSGGAVRRWGMKQCLGGGGRLFGLQLPSHPTAFKSC